MGKNKLARFAENETFENLFQHTHYDIRNDKFPLKGRWNEDYFKNDNPIILELGCGKGEYTTGLAQFFPNSNFIGVDRKGARIWSGCKQAIESNIKNVAFIRTKIEDISLFFAENEVSEIWVTFPDPQPKKARRRLASNFIEKYRKFAVKGALLHLKPTADFFTNTHSLQRGKKGGDIRKHRKYLLRINKLSIKGIQTFYEKWVANDLIISYLKLRIS